MYNFKYYKYIFRHGKISNNTIITCYMLPKMRDFDVYFQISKLYFYFEGITKITINIRKKGYSHILIEIRSLEDKDIFDFTDYYSIQYVIGKIRG